MAVGNVVKLNCFELFEKGDEDLELESYSRKLNFISGMKDGLPIALGYISVAFAFGILALEKGFPIWAPILISATNFTGTGQFVGIDLIASYATLSEIAFTILIINLRYVLMSLSLSQKIVHNATLGERLLIAFGVTDEIFVVSMGKTQAVTFPYMMGLILSAYCGWVLGTVLGVVASSALPIAVRSALGITLYAMFIAIIVPPASTSRPVLIVVLIAVIMSCMFRWVPGLSNISSGWVMVICGVVSSAVGAYFFPVENSGGPDLPETKEEV